MKWPAYVTQAWRRLRRRSLEKKAQHHFQQGCSLWASDPHRLIDAIREIEEAWRIAPTSALVIQLVIMYDRANRHQDSVEILKHGLKLFPEDEAIKCYSVMTFLRHGTATDVLELCDVIDRMEATDLFCNAIRGVYRRFSEHVNAIEQQISAADRPPYVVVVPVWGPKYIADFLRYCASSLMAEGNLPWLNRHRSLHVVIFTTANDEVLLRNDPMFMRLKTHARVLIRHYDPGLMPDEAALLARYGERFCEYYRRTFKFLAMSLAHYAALEAGRRADALVTAIGADNVFGDHALSRLSEAIDDGADVVLVAAHRLSHENISEVVESSHRKSDGTISLPSAAYAKLIAANMPSSYFANSGDFVAFPIMMCWRVGEEALLVHANHFHPYCIRASALSGPLTPSIDPVDGRFLARHLRSAERLHVVRDDRILISDWSDAPVIEQSGTPTNKFIARDVGLWLWGFWDHLREPLLRSSVRIGSAPGRAWQEAEAEADKVIDEIVATACKYENAKGAYQPQSVDNPMTVRQAETTSSVVG